MSTEERRGGAAVAPDATDEELALIEEPGTVLRPAGPLTPEEQAEASQQRVERIASMTGELAGKEAPTLEEGMARARAKREGASEGADLTSDEVRDALDPPMDPGEAADAMSMMLAVDTAPAPKVGFLRIKRLSEEYGRDFYLRMRGLTEDEITRIDAEAVRPATKEEQDRGFPRVMSDGGKRDRLIIIASSLNPRFDDPQLLARFGGKDRDPEEVVKAWLNPGERVDAATLATELMGFSDDATSRPRAVLDAKKS